MTNDAAAAGTVPHQHVGRDHRPEIDGLRAVAVVPVILFHAGFSAFAGGYVGVDVFFVISGYLITSIIIRERLAGRFSLAGFYERRARRILPALFLVMAVCVPLAWWWMLPAELEDFGKSLAAVPLFVSKVLFWRTSGYFGGAGEFKPLLHTWSLGIEEQYYVIFPLVVAMLLRFGLHRMIFGLALFAAVSLGLSIYLTDRLPLANFFLLPTRAWELLAGSLLATIGVAGVALPQARWWREVAGLIGLAMIVVPIFAYDASTPFPGLAAVPVAVGTAMLLAFVDPKTLVGRWLTLPPMLWIGAISYSAYLWHQPMFAFARLIVPQELPGWLYLVLAGGSLALAYGSWRLVEAPFRDRRNFSRAAIFGMATGGSLLFVATGAVLAIRHGSPERIPAAYRSLTAPAKTNVEGCPSVGGGVHVCTLGTHGAVPTIALVGDSHAYALASALDAELRRRGIAGILVHTDCHPIPGIFDSREPQDGRFRKSCAVANAGLKARVTAPDIKLVVVAVRWTMRLYPMGDFIDAPAFDNHEGGLELDAPYRRNLTIAPDGTADDSALPKSRAVRAYLSDLARAKPVAVVYPVPEVGFLPTHHNMASIARGIAPPALLTTDYARYLTRNRAAIDVLDGVTSAGVRRIRPAAAMCDRLVRARCVVQAHGALYYYDDDHLSNAGAAPVVRAILDRAVSEARPLAVAR